jgi:Universal stress protein family.
MMTHGRSGIKRWLLGSTVRKVIGEIGKPALIIRAKAAPVERERGILNRVVVPLDGSKIAEVTLPYVEELMTGVTTKEAERAMRRELSPIPCC